VDKRGNAALEFSSGNRKRQRPCDFFWRGSDEWSALPVPNISDNKNSSRGTHLNGVVRSNDLESFRCVYVQGIANVNPCARLDCSVCIQIRPSSLLLGLMMNLLVGRR
jgi:hypothetical protein